MDAQCVPFTLSEKIYLTLLWICVPAPHQLYWMPAITSQLLWCSVCPSDHQMLIKNSYSEVTEKQRGPWTTRFHFVAIWSMNAQLDAPMVLFQVIWTLVPSWTCNILCFFSYFLFLLAICQFFNNEARTTLFILAQFYPKNMYEI